MPSKKQYNLVHNDEYDTRIPLHSEEAFHRGIVFHAKFIGSMEVPRPTSRMEIVAAMRRIRYEFKAKGIKKKKVTLEVSVDGLKVTLRKKKKKQHWLDESKLVLMHHPIYRIFYVSHDSHDLKIFSYIARDGSGNSFRCNVFKSSKKSQAMRVVRTVGQAFEVCHKLSLNNPAAPGDDHQQKDRVSGDGENHRRDPGDDYSDDFACLQPQPSPSSVHKDISLLGDTDDSILDQPCPLRSHHHEVTTTTGGVGGGPTTCPASPLRQSPLGNAIPEQLMNGELTALKHEIQLVRERLDQQSQQTRAAVAHARLLQDQLAAETAARVEAQARTHQLLVQNKELLEHIAALVSHLREHERISGVPLSSQSVGQVTSSGSLNNQNSAVPDIAALGQYTSIWEAAAASCPHYSPLESYYSASSPLGYSRNGYLEDQLRYQAQIWENVRASSSPYPPPSPIPPYSPPQHYFGPGFSLPPSGRPRSAQPPPSPSSTLPRPSRLQAATSPNTYQQQQQRCSTPRSRSLERPMHNNSTAPSSEQQETSFIKPLPCKNCNNSPQRGEVPRARSSSLSLLKNNLHDLMRPLVLDPPPPGRLNRSEQLSIAVQTEPLLNHQAPNCPVILLTDTLGKRSGAADRMSKIEETESGEEGDDVAELPRTMRRNSQ